MNALTTVPSVPELDVLQPKQQKFVLEYLIDLDAPAAYIRAGYLPGSTHNSTKVMSYRLLRQQNIQLAVSRVNLARLAKVNVTGQTVIEALAQIAFIDIRELFNVETNELKPMKDWPVNAAKALASLDVERGRDGVTVAKIRLWDKLSALQMLAKHLNLLQPDDREKAPLEIRWIEEEDEEPVAVPESRLLTEGPASS